MLIGVPASGKTTWTIKNHPSIGYASTDKYIDRFAAERGVSYDDAFDTSIKEATSLMIEEVGTYVVEEKDFVWDQTNLSKKSRAKKLKFLSDYNVVAVVFETPEKSVLKERLDRRPGKTIPHSVLKSMLESFELPTIDEGFSKIVIAE
jgi:predicted kinase